uniref:3'(2'),5'-bisphosphate nucleotidase 1 n=1 Tax=Panagrellus redivivus TaxID=6233 RepID=A0A7E5A0Z0_PANRE
MSLTADEMWARSSFLTRLVASSATISEAAGDIIKAVMTDGDLKVINKSAVGQPIDVQTEADRAAQYIIEKSLQLKFDNKLTIIGEEEVTSEVERRESGFSTDVLALEDRLPAEFKAIKPEDVVVWVDPLDGTSEFAAKSRGREPKLNQVTVLIGIAYKNRAIAGVVHQPYYNGTESRTVVGIVNTGVIGLNVISQFDEKVVVTTASHSTDAVKKAIEALEKANLADRIEKVSGAGFKVLKCLEGATAYVFASHGCKKWDTCAPEALLVAAGGTLTDISGRPITYAANVQHPNTGGVLATAPTVNHDSYVNAIPDDVKAFLPETPVVTSKQ